MIRRRPIGVWIISGLVFTLTYFALVSAILTALGISLLPNPTLSFDAYGALLSLVYLLAATWLWFLRKHAVVLFAAALVLGVAHYLWGFVDGRPLLESSTYSRVLRWDILIGAAMNHGIALAMLVYAWHLRRREVLH